MKLIGIIRVSTAEQAQEQRAGIARQRDSIERIAAHHGATLTLLTISDVSGSDLGLTSEWRDQVVPQLSNPHTHLAVDAVDRLARPDKFDFQVLAAIQGTGTLIYTPEGAVNLSRPDGFMLGGLRALFGAFEKMELKRRLQGGKEAKRRKGEHVQASCCLPRGVTYDPETYRWGYNDDAWRVQKAFSMLVEDGVENLSEISRTVGVSVSSGLQGIIRNPIYRGWRIYDMKRGTAYASQNGRQAGRRKVKRSEDEVIKVQVFGLEDQEPALIDGATWHRAQEILDRIQAARRKQKKLNPANWLTGYLVSAKERVHPTPTGNIGEPKHVMYARGHGDPKAGKHYQCRCQRVTGHPLAGPRCGLRTFPVDLVNQAVDEVLTRITTGELFRDQVLKGLKADRGGKVKDMDRLKRALSKLKGKQSRLVDLMIDDAIPRDIWDTKCEALRAEQRALEAELGKFNGGSAPLDEEAVTSHLEGMVYDRTWAPLVKRAWVQKYIRYVRVGENSIQGIMLRLPTGDWGYLDEWTWVDLLGFEIRDRGARLRARLNADGCCLASDVGAKLGIHVDTIRWHINRGNLPRPAGKKGRMMIWTAAELAATVEAYRALKKS